MSTRCRIALRLEGCTAPSYHSIYCHFDGYEDGVGKILRQSYQTEERVKWLLDLGELRGLSPNGVEIYLDRKAQVIPAAFSPSLAALQELAYDKSGAEFLYVFADGQWHTLRPGQPHGL